MNRESMDIHSIKPFVRFAQDIYITPAQKHMYAKSYDHRLFYVISGSAILEIGNIVKEISSGHVLYWASGLTYRFEPGNEQALHMIAINFDFTQANRESVQYLPVVSPGDYAEEKRLEDIVFTDAAVLNAPILIQNLPSVLPYIQALVSEADQPALFSEFQLSNLLNIVLTMVCRAASQRQIVKGQINSYRQIIDYINSHYAEDIDNHFLAATFGYHPKYISQLITQHTGIPLHQYLLKVRIRNAIYLLQTSPLSISEIARRVGFKNASYFSEYFRRCTGYSPRAFRLV